MLPVGRPDACAPRIVHSHTHIHHHHHKHRHNVRHVHQKAARFVSASPDSFERGRSGRPTRAAPRAAARSPSPEPTTKSGKLKRFFRKKILPVLLFLGDALMFIATRISFGFGYRVDSLPFLGPNSDAR